MAEDRMVFREDVRGRLQYGGRGSGGLSVEMCEV